MKYLWVNVLILGGPLALSFDSRVSYFRRWPAVFATLLVVGFFYVVWDSRAARRGDWSFNPRYLVGTRLWGLPLEEILFFVTVPFSCLFILECVRAYLPGAPVFYSPPLYLLPALAFVFLAWLFRERPYTRTVALVTGLFLLLAASLGREMVSSSHFWLALLFTYLPFLLFNGVLTGLPIVIYQPRAILGVRVFSIPLEDFFYSFSMLGFYFLVFLMLRPRLGL
jgi:lycopene cyclase domain-containing protein